MFSIITTNNPDTENMVNVISPPHLWLRHMDGGDPCNGEEAQQYPGLVSQAMTAAWFRKVDIKLKSKIYKILYPKVCKYLFDNLQRKYMFLFICLSLLSVILFKIWDWAKAGFFLRLLMKF